MDNPILKDFMPISILILLLSFYSMEAQNKFNTPYGNNVAVGKLVELNGAKIYYEEYGIGQPLILIHGNGADIKSLENQIDFFKNKYRVIVADSRGHGRSELKTDSLTYDQMTKDWIQLVSYLKLDSLNILGWSDGGIIGLMMGMSQTPKIKKIVAMGANLRPDTTAVNNWAPESVRENLIHAQEMVRKRDTSIDWNLKLQYYDLLLNQPKIISSDLKKIKASVLIMAGDRDVIKNTHSVEIYENLTKGQLCIMPGTNHDAPQNKPKMFNEIVNEFLSKKD